MASSDKLKEASERARKAAGKEKERIEAAAHKVEAHAKKDRATLHEHLAGADRHEGPKDAVSPGAAMRENRTRGAKRTTRPAPLTVCVQHHPRGRWEVITEDGRGRISAKR